MTSFVQSSSGDDLKIAAAMKALMGGGAKPKAVPSLVCA